MKKITPRQSIKLLKTRIKTQKNDILQSESHMTSYQKLQRPDYTVERHLQSAERREGKTPNYYLRILLIERGGKHVNETD